jgi:biotin transport system substrate-specific component
MSANLLASRIWPATGNVLLRNAVLAIAGSLLVAAAAHVAIVKLPVPITLQTLAVLAIGAVYGWRLGAATLALYAAEGAAGLPVFAPTPDGYPGITGPTGGYVLGFILAAALIGWFVERGWDRSIPKMILATLLAAAVLYIPGLIWLSGFVGGLDKAVEYGFAPFWLWDTVKALVVALGVPAASALLGRK